MIPLLSTPPCHNLQEHLYCVTCLLSYCFSTSPSHSEHPRTEMMRRCANFGFKEGASLFTIVRKYSHRSFHSATAPGAAAGSKLQSLREVLGRDDDVADAALFKSQVLAGMSSLNDVYAYVDGQKVAALIAQDNANDGGNMPFKERYIAIGKKNKKGKNMKLSGAEVLQLPGGKPSRSSQLQKRKPSKTGATSESAFCPPPQWRRREGQRR